MSEYIHPTGILKNTKTGRFHPISFRPAPFSGNEDLNRYKSIGHHTDGFDTREEAIAFVKTVETMEWTGLFWEWNGEDVPAMVVFMFKDETPFGSSWFE
jgi:hypothetical protein